MKTLKYVDLVEIGTIVFELWWAEIGYLTGHVNNTLLYAYFLTADTWPCVLICNFEIVSYYEMNNQYTIYVP